MNSTPYSWTLLLSIKLFNQQLIVEESENLLTLRHTAQKYEVPDYNAHRINSNFIFIISLVWSIHFFTKCKSWGVESLEHPWYPDTGYFRLKWLKNYLKQFITVTQQQYERYRLHTKSAVRFNNLKRLFSWN